MARAQPERRRAPAPERTLEDARTPGLWLVLALVIEEPSHGYEIVQRYEDRFGSLLPMSFPRLYGALDRLREAGMIEPVTIKPAKPAGRQHLMRRSYKATAAGTKAYRQWVAGHMHDDPERLELLARVASTGLFGIDAVLDVIDRYQQECIEELRVLPTGDASPRDDRSELEDLMRSLVVDQRRRELAAQNDWAVHAREALQALKRDGAAQPKRRARTDRAS
jgi:DNA-binding PadR family transcriptional regulator